MTTCQAFKGNQLARGPGRLGEGEEHLIWQFLFKKAQHAQLRNRQRLVAHTVGEK